MSSSSEIRIENLATQPEISLAQNWNVAFLESALGGEKVHTEELEEEENRG